MEQDNKKIEQIERYLLNQLAGEELSDFTNKMKSDVIFKSEVEEYRKLFVAMKGYSKRKELKDTLDSVHATLQSGSDTSALKTTKIRSLFSDKKIWGAAASVALVISLGTYLLMNFVNSFTGNDRAHYQALRLDLERVKSSQKIIIKELKEDKQPLKQASFGGTAIAISADGYVLTSYHVVKDVATVYIENKKYSRLKLKRIYTDPFLDLVIMKVDDDSFKTFGTLPFTFRKNGLELGEKVFTLGYPKQDVVFGEGYISSINGYEGDTASYQIAVPVNPGQSGGPLFDESGNLVGIVSGKHTENEGSAFAVKANYLKEAILSNDSLSTLIKFPKYNNMKSQGKIQMIKKAQEYVFEVKGYN